MLMMLNPYEGSLSVADKVRVDIPSSCGQPYVGCEHCEFLEFCPAAICIVSSRYVPQLTLDFPCF